MNFLEKLGGLLPGVEPPEAPYTPLGFAPYEARQRQFIFGKPRSEYEVSQRAIDASVDSQLHIPQHVREGGRIALYSELTKQAGRNMIADPGSVPEAALRGRMQPDELIELMRDHDDLRAVELARLTHFGVRDVDDLIMEPIKQRLLNNKSIKTTDFARGRRRFKREFVSPEIMMVGVKLKRWTHLDDSIVTSCRQLFVLDMQHESNSVHPDGAGLRAALASHLDSDHDLPEWIVPGATTFFAFHPRRLQELKRQQERERQMNDYNPLLDEAGRLQESDRLFQNHYDTSPNLPVWRYETRSTLNLEILAKPDDE